MKSAERNQLRAALYLCIADLFIGAAGVIIILVVLATRTEVARYPRNVDFVVACEDAGGAWAITTGGGESKRSIPIEDWIRSVEPRGLIARIGVLTPATALGCYAAVEKAVLAHNRQLTTRPGQGGVVAVVFLPEVQHE